MKRWSLLAVLALWSLTGIAADDRAEIDAVLDVLHARADAADFEGYFALYTDDAVFLGTDAEERWPIDEFRTYTARRFATGTGWTYVALERHVDIEADGALAWFDEVLRNERLGLCRGSGVLRRTAEGWKIAQYNLTLLVPNEIATDVADMARPFDEHPVD